MNEAQIKPLFDQWGTVRDVMILRERSTGASRGCAFVGYESSDEAQAAITHLDHRVHLPNALGPLEVRFARGRNVSNAGSSEDSRQLFFSGAPAAAGEGDLQALFRSAGGAVESMSLARDPETQESRGCGVVTMSTRQEAQAVIDALDGKATLEGASGPLAVRWADPDARGRKGDEHADDLDDRTVFFARVLRSAKEEAVRALFSRFGRVADVNLFRAFQGAPTTKGCGLVTMSSVEEASAAIQGLHEQHTWQGMTQPMVVRWMDSALQRRRKEEHVSVRQQAAPQAPAVLPGGYPASLSAPANAMGARGPLGPGPGPALLAGQHHHPLFDGGAAAGPYGGLPAEVPPPGCAPDAYKLFIGNVPSCYSERDLRPLFDSVGPVVELVVLYDKQTGASKGSAFCWYASRSDADRAAAQFNERHLLPDPTGHQQRPLVVRPATVRRAVPRALLGGAGGGGAGAPLGALGAAAAAGLAPQYGYQHPRAAAGMAAAGMAGGGGMGRLMHPLALGGGAPDSGGGAGFSSSSFLLDHSAAFSNAVSNAGGHDGHGGDGGLASGSFTLGAGSGPDSGGYAAVVNSGSLGLAPPPGAVSGGGGGGGGAPGGGGWDAGGGGGQLHQLQYVPMSQQAALPSMSRGGGGEVLTVQVPVLSSQLQAVTPHVFSIQSASGAEVMTQAVAPGVFCLRLSGSKLAVDTASQLISSVLQNAA